MKIFRLVIGVCLLHVTFNLKAQNILDNINASLSSSGLKAAYSLRLLSNYYSGPLIRIRVNSNYYDVYPDQNLTISLNSPISSAIAFGDGKAAPSDILSSLNATDAYIGKWFDQSGYGVDASQSQNQVYQPKVISL